MTTRSNAFEQFILLFNALKSIANDDPQAMVRQYEHGNSAVRIARDALWHFLLRTDFERRVFHGPRKYFLQTPGEFEKLWSEYKTDWHASVNFPFYFELDGIEIFGDDLRQTAEGVAVEPAAELEAPDPEFDTAFDPIHHDGESALKLGYDHVSDEIVNLSHGKFAEDEVVENLLKIFQGAYDYLTETIGLSLEDVFRRWRRVPITFMPAHVSNRHGLSEAGSLYDLLDDAVRAYVCGAPAAAIAMCRAALEMILKKHYDLDYQFKDRQGTLRDKGLGELIILADEKYKFIQGSRLKRLANGANTILHDYTRQRKLPTEADQTILEFLKTLKFMIERAPSIKT